MSAEGEVEVAQPASTYDWFASIPLASSAGSAVYSWYEGSKNCCRLSQFAIGTMESSVKYAAGTAAPLVKKFDKPSKFDSHFPLTKQFVTSVLAIHPHFVCFSCCSPRNGHICCPAVGQTGAESSLHQEIAK